MPLARFTNALLAVVVATSTLIGSAQTITVRLIDARNGRPLPNQLVTVSLLSNAHLLQERTNAVGEAEFILPDPTPAHLDIRVRLGEHWHCGCMISAKTQEVMEKGLIDAIGKKALPAKSAVPGVVVLAAWPYTLMERLLAPLEHE